MKTKEKKLMIGRRNAVKMLGLSSAALFTSGFGNVSSARAKSIKQTEMAAKSDPDHTLNRALMKIALQSPTEPGEDDIKFIQQLGIDQCCFMDRC